VKRGAQSAALLAALVLAGCGSSDESVPADAVAVVDGEEIARSDYEALITQAKKSYKNQERDFPAAGSQELQTLRNQIVQYLVQREQFEQEAEELGIEVNDEQVDARMEQIVKQYFAGDRKKYEQQLAEQGMSDAQVLGEVRAQLVSEKIFTEVAGDVKVTDDEVEEYYEKNKAQYSQPESREVRHILVKTKAEADNIYAQLQDGADFDALAKQHSEDPGSKETGGKLTISKGQTVAPFDQAAFLLETNALSKPVKTEFGYHIIQPLGDTKPAQVTPHAEVKASIEQQLQQTKKNEAMTKWVDDLKKDYEDKVSYAPGFTPPPPDTTAATTPTR
jgi:parvulin-like peptidyl-prolyl isomerase